MAKKSNIPQHIAIIMDGNGRWARHRGLPRSAGHRAGMERVKEIVRAAAESGVKFLTLFAFSTENWVRPRDEVNMLMRALNNYLSRQLDELNKKNIRLLFIGRDEPVPRVILDNIRKAEEKTRDNTGLTVILAFNYGARQEIVDAAKKFSRAVINGKADIAGLDPERFSRYLYTEGLPDPDLLIRTSGEMRLSNFLLWQLSYAELYFARKFWPDFRGRDLEKAILEYGRRERRFGGVDAGKEGN